MKPKALIVDPVYRRACASAQQFRSHAYDATITTHPGAALQLYHRMTPKARVVVITYDSLLEDSPEKEETMIGLKSHLELMQMSNTDQQTRFVLIADHTPQEIQSLPYLEVAPFATRDDVLAKILGDQS